MSLEATNQRSLQLVASLVKDTSIPTPEIPTIPRSHDDMFLSKADSNIGERPCCLAERCIARFLALMRFGEDTEYAFVCKEFLLPSERVAFLTTGKLPPQPGKCLLCSYAAATATHATSSHSCSLPRNHRRYFHTYLHRLARASPAFVSSSPVPVQAFGNVVCSAVGDDYPTHASAVDAYMDGYPSSAILVCESGFGSTSASRGPMGAFQWRPVVAFHSSNYTYSMGEDGETPRIVQNFRQPVFVRDERTPA